MKHTAAAFSFARLRRIAGLAVTAALIAAVPAAASAEGKIARAGRVSIGGFLGGFLMPDNSGLGNAFFSDDVPQSGLGLGVRLGYAIVDNLDVEGEFHLTPTTLPHPPEASALVMSARLLARYTLVDDIVVKPFVTAGIGQLMMSTSKEFVKSFDVDNAYLFGAGFLYDASYRLALRLDARWIGSDVRPNDDGTLAHNFEFTVGVQYAFGGAPEDTDGDGIPNDADKCPDKAEDKDGFEDDDGCPEIDNDGDGVVDSADRCPAESEDKDGFEDDDGCPDLDNDKDGIPDAKDKCPNEAEDKDGFQDDDGCPDADNDNDGIPDAKDKCPNKAEDKDGFQDDDGCPDLDNDGDGIPDAKDKCPNEAETPNGFQDDDGCADQMAPHIAPLFQAPVYLKFRGAKLDKKAAATLEKLLELLLEFEAIKLEIHVHTGGSNAEKEKALAQTRGEAIRQFFTDAGIDGGRFIIMAHGNEKPISSKKGKKGAAENERVEFRVHTPPPRPNR
ncbi:MAG: outer membrane beta-barrel protein [Deltaproteobacteria bacterium]|nr:outer membrane beta-barrel protein [Deltaproteobacteria bacterium]